MICEKFGGKSKVEYDKPRYNENYPVTFTFKISSIK